MPLNEEHAEFEREVQAEIGHRPRLLDELLSKFPNAEAITGPVRETYRALMEKILEAARRTWPPQPKP
jgi:hypothetical protein